MPSTDKIFICECWILIDIYGLYVYFLRKIPGKRFLSLGWRSKDTYMYVVCSALCIFVTGLFRSWWMISPHPAVERKVPSSLGLVEYLFPWGTSPRLK